MVKECTCKREDLWSIPGLVRCPGEGNGCPLTPVFWSGEAQRQRNWWLTLPMGHQEWDVTEWLRVSYASPGASDGKGSACNVGDPSSILGLGRSPREGNDNRLQCSCLENPRDRGAWGATVHGVSKSQMWLSDLPFPHCFLFVCLFVCFVVVVVCLIYCLFVCFLHTP